MYLTLNNSRSSVQILSYKLSFVISHHNDEYFEAFVAHPGGLLVTQTRNVDLFLIGCINELLVSFENAGNSGPSVC
jgi:hypothetical protein